MPAGLLLGPKGWFSGKIAGVGSCPARGKSGCCGSRNFFLGGEKGVKRMDGMLENSSTSHGLTRFTFCNKSGSSHVT